MPLRTERYDLGDVLDDLESELESHADEQAKYDPGTDGAKEAAAHGQQVERYRNGVAYQREAWDADSIELAALTHGEREFMHDIAEDLGLPSVTNAYVAVGTRSAPYLAHDPERIPSNMAAVKQTVAAVPELHPWFVDWVESEITELGKVGGETGKSYRELVQERRDSTNQDATSG